MNLLVARIHWLMAVSGVLTCTMVAGLFAPDSALQSTFGATLEGPVADVVVRNWGALIALVGGMLIYGAFKPAVRGLVLAVAALSKAIFIGLVLAHGALFLSYQAGVAVAVAVDGAMVALFAAYWLAAPVLSARRQRDLLV
jgi:hypothetical protein